MKFNFLFFLDCLCFWCPKNYRVIRLERLTLIFFSTFSIILALMFRYLNNFELVSNMPCVQGSAPCFGLWISSCWKYCRLPLNCPHILIKSQLMINGRPCFRTLNSINSSTCLVLCQSTLSWLSLLKKCFEIEKHFVLFSKIVLSVFSPLHFCRNWRISLCFCK